MGPPKDVRPSFRNAVKTSLTRPLEASLLIGGHRQPVSVLHRFAGEFPNPDLCESEPPFSQPGCFVEFSRDASLALHARNQIALAFHRMEQRGKSSGAEPRNVQSTL